MWPVWLSLPSTVHLSVRAERCDQVSPRLRFSIETRSASAGGAYWLQRLSERIAYDSFDTEKAISKTTREAKRRHHSVALI